MAPVAPSSAGIKIRNFEFDPKELIVPVGTEVKWIDQGGRHSVQFDDASFHSEILTAGGIFKRRFDRPGIYRYYCEFHGAPGGHDMAGVVIVK